MSARVSKISLTVFAVMLVLSGFLLSTAGGTWPWYAVTSVFAAVPLVVGPRRYRVWGALGLALSVLLIFGDVVAGKRLRERRSPKASVDAMTQPNQPAAGKARITRLFTTEYHFARPA